MQLCMQLYLGEYNYMYIKKVEKKIILMSLLLGNKLQSYLNQHIKMYNNNHKFNHNCKFL